MSDVFETLEVGSAFCISLEVERNEGCIADPTLLKIVKIVPTFMSSEAFLDSATFNLKQDPAAQGFGQRNQAGLAMGVARETVTGVLPLYLFPEHWSIARRRSPPLLGLMCTLDIMGFQPSQQFAIPFKVLQKATEDYKAEPTDKNKFVLKLILETCQAIVELSGDFRKGLFKTLLEFIEKPEARTTDVVPNIQILLYQAFALSQIEGFREKYAEEGAANLDKERLQRLFRFAYEELMRRGFQRANKNPLLDEELLGKLFPDFKGWIDGLAAKKKADITNEVIAILNANPEEAMLPFHEQAQKYREMDAQAAAEGRAVDEIPAHAKLKRADSKASGQEERKLGESRSNVSAAPLSVTDSSKSDTTVLKSLDMSDLFELMSKKLQEQPWKGKDLDMFVKENAKLATKGFQSFL